MSDVPWVILLDIRKSVSYNSGRSCFEYFCKQIECGGDIYFERKEKGALQKSLDSNFKIKGMVIRIIRGEGTHFDSFNSRKKSKEKIGPIL